MKAYIASNIKTRNRETVYNLISSRDNISKAEISRMTGISAPTVLKIVDFFLQKNLLIKGGTGDTNVGRKPQLLNFNPLAYFSVGIDFEGDYLRIGIIDLAGNVISKKKVYVKSSFNKTIDIIHRNTLELIKGNDILRENILGIGLGLPGIVDYKNNMLELAPLIGISEKTDISEMLARLNQDIGLPIYIENDVNSAALGEYKVRDLKEEDLVYISLGTGLGAGIILNGQLRRGKKNSAGEIGYMIFDKSFNSSQDKPGWLESLINIDAVTKKFKADFDNIKNIEKNKIIQEYIASYLGLVISNITSILDIKLIVLGGITIETYRDTIISYVNNYINKFCVNEITCELEKSTEPGLVGAASIVTKHELSKVFKE